MQLVGVAFAGQELLDSDSLVVVLAEPYLAERSFRDRPRHFHIGRWNAKHVQVRELRLHGAPVARVVERKPRAFHAGWTMHEIRRAVFVLFGLSAHSFPRVDGKREHNNEDGNGDRNDDRRGR